MSNCVICDSLSVPYKCPKCKIPYCSVTCFKEHTAKGCEPINTASTSDNSSSDYKHVTEDTVPVEKLKLLGESIEMHAVLKNPHVRAILLEIDKNPNAAEIMERAMKEPIFIEFADACLKVVEGENKDVTSPDPD